MTHIDALIALIEVIGDEMIFLRGLRLSPSSAIAGAAVERERALESELAKLRAKLAAQQQGLRARSEGVNSVPA